MYEAVNGTLKLTDFSLKRDIFSKYINIMESYIPSARICAPSVISSLVFPHTQQGLC